MPELKRAALIEGEVLLQRRVPFRAHGEPHPHLIGWLGPYAAFTPHLMAAGNASVRLDWDNEPQPDSLLLIERAHGGQTYITDDDVISGAPELIGEVCPSSASLEIHAKKHVYRRNGVREYLVWRVLDRQFDWFVLRDGEFHLHAASQDGILKSTVFPGLWLDAAALIDGKLAQVLAVLDRGIKSPEHEVFVAKLATT